jgi:hypothetical protein
MTAPDPEEPKDPAAILAEHGFVITEEGKARARAKLGEADRRITAERREQLRRFGRDAP